MKYKQQNYLNFFTEEDVAMRNETSEPYGPSNPFFAPMLRCERITSADHFQDTRLVEFDIEDSAIDFGPGDVCMIQPKNLEENVERFVKLFSRFDVDAVFSMSTNDDDAK